MTKWLMHTMTMGFKSQLSSVFLQDARHLHVSKLLDVTLMLIIHLGVEILVS